MPGNPIVIAYHLVWTVYGWWLPNDPRGSWSETIATDVLAELGDLHFGRKRVQPAGEVVREFYDRAAEMLQYPLLSFGPREIAIVWRRLGRGRRDPSVYVLGMRGDGGHHIHILIRKHKHSAEEMIENLKMLSRKRLEEAGGPWCDHPVWAGGGGWKVFLDHPDEVRRTIPYIESNPRKAHLAAQAWPYVQAYDGWPLHPGHSEYSPYVKALKAAGRYAR